MLNTTNLFSLAQNKLQVSIGGKDKCSLHRWVLLKNSILNSPVTPTHSAPFDTCTTTPTYQHPEDEHEEEINTEDNDSFMFPDAGKLVGPTTDVNGSESEWLDSLLETLGDEDEDDYAVEQEAQSSTLLTTDEEDDDSIFFSPSSSPMSSSDDLPNLPTQPSFYPSVAYSYSYPYIMHPPLLAHFESSTSDPYHEPLPYSDLSDSETLSVPDAIEDISDDESDAPPTPSIGHSASSLALIEAASPSDRSHLRQVYPVVRVDAEDSYFYPFELDPLPFPLSEDSPAYNTYQEC